MEFPLLPQWSTRQRSSHLSVSILLQLNSGGTANRYTGLPGYSKVVLESLFVSATVFTNEKNHPPVFTQSLSYHERAQAPPQHCIFRLLTNRGFALKPGCPDNLRLFLCQYLSVLVCSPMTLQSPFIITARLMAGLAISDAFLSIETGSRDSENRTQYSCFLDLSDGSEHFIDSIASGCGGGDIQDGMESLLSFLSAAAESYRHRKCDWNKVTEDDNATLFSRPVVEWAYQNSDEISMAAIELEEKDLIDTSE